MIFEVVTLFPEMVTGMTDVGVVGAAFKKNLLTLTTINPRDFTGDVHRSVDDRPYGGGDGMVMMIEPLERALTALKAQHAAASAAGTDVAEEKNRPGRSKVIFLSPQGKLWNDQMARDYANLDRITMISGRYGGVDERFLELHQIEEISIGDYVLSGGELAAGVLIDSIARHVPGVLGHKESANEESHSKGTLEAPQYTRPVAYGGKKVPDVLLSGNHQKIQAWRRLMGFLVTRKKRPDLFEKLELSEKDLQQLNLLEKELSQ